MAVYPRGTPASYTDSSSNVFGGLVVGDNGVNSDIAYFDYTQSKWVVTSALSTRDDTTATPNSYAIIQITEPKFQGT
jgi:hypothetical protein